MLLSMTNRVALAGLVLSTLLRPLAASGQCVNYRDYLHVAGSVYTPGSAQDVEVSGSYAYVADFIEGLQVVDISDPASPQIVGGIGLLARAVEISGSYAYVAGFYAGLQVVDISNPTSPLLVGSVGGPWIIDVAVSGNYAYVTEESLGLQVVDISIPAAPVIVGTVAMPGSALGVAVLGNYAYVTDESSGLQVVDVSDPTAPAIVGAVAMPGSALGVAVSGNYVCVTDTVQGLQVVAVSNPTDPQIVGSVDLGFAGDVTVSGSHAYVGDRDSGLRAVDISNPSAPVVVGTAYMAGRPRGAAVSGNYAYVANLWSGLEVVDISNPTSVPVVGVATPSAHYVAMSGSYGYVAGWPRKLRVVNLSDPASPTIVGSVDVLHAKGVAASGSYAYVTDVYSGLQVVDASAPALPEIVASVPMPGESRGVAVSGSYAYVGTSGASGNSGSLQVVDVSSPASAATVGSVDTPSGVTGVAVWGNFAYVGASANYGSSGSLHVIDVSDPTSPAIVGTLPMQNNRPFGVAVSESHVYIAALNELEIVDVSAPASPVLVGRLRTPGGAYDVAVSGGYAYVAAPYLYLGGSQDFYVNSALHVIDVSDPAFPTLVGSVDTPRWTHCVAVSGGFAYAASSTGGLLVFPALCEEPVPVLLSGFTAEPSDRAVELSWFTSFESAHDGFHLYRSGRLASGYSRLNTRLLRGRSPYSYLDSTVRPLTTYYYKLGAVDSRGNEVLHPPTSVTTPPVRAFRTALAPGSPNPFRTEATLSFTLGSPQTVTLAIYDVAGRLVREVARGEFPGGEHSATWDGRDDSGLRVAGGTYFVRFNAGGTSQAEKVVYLGQ